MENSSKIKIVAVIAIIAAPFLIYQGMQERSRLATLEKDGITVDGEIISGESSGRRRSRNYDLQVRFELANGGVLTKEFPVTASFFDSHTEGRHITDPVVQVRYLPKGARDSAIIVGGSTDDALMFPFGIGAFVLGVGALGFMMTRKA